MTFQEQVKELNDRKRRVQDQAADASDLATLKFCQAQIKLINWELECLTGDKQ